MAAGAALVEIDVAMADVLEKVADSPGTCRVIDSSDFARISSCSTRSAVSAGRGALLYHSGMSTAGVFVFLLIAFLALHRWYIRPQRDTGRRSRAADQGARREHPGDPDREPGQQADSHGHAGGRADASHGSAGEAAGGGHGGNGGNGQGGGGGDSGSGDGD